MPSVTSLSERSSRFSAHISQRVGEPRDEHRRCDEEKRFVRIRNGESPGAPSPSRRAPWSQRAHDRRLQPEESNQDDEPGFLRDHCRHREGDGRDHQLRNSGQRRAGSYGKQHEGGCHDHGREQSPSRFEHLRPVGTPCHRQIDHAEPGENEPAEREQPCKHTRRHPPHRHSLHHSTLHRHRCSRSR